MKKEWHNTVIKVLNSHYQFLFMNLHVSPFDHIGLLSSINIALHTNTSTGDSSTDLLLWEPSPFCLFKSRTHNQNLTPSIWGKAIRSMQKMNMVTLALMWLSLDSSNAFISLSSALESLTQRRPSRTAESNAIWSSGSGFRQKWLNTFTNSKKVGIVCRKPKQTQNC